MGQNHTCESLGNQIVRKTISDIKTAVVISDVIGSFSLDDFGCSLIQNNVVDLKFFVVDKVDNIYIITVKS